jgi:hypothetical protein
MEKYQEEMRKTIEEQNFSPNEPLGVATVIGSKEVLQSLQNDLRKAGYRKVR